jgi:4-diphosphocytidyl-2-C-methyl-D-erythritol kinase
LPVLLGQLRTRFGLAPGMSGSGSACFALLPDEAPVGEITAAVRVAWGASAFVVVAKLA